MAVYLRRSFLGPSCFHMLLHEDSVQEKESAFTYLTAPNNAPSHSFFSVSTVLSGKATPVCLKVSKPASRSTKENFSPSDDGKASSIRRPAGMTSLPMPSPGMRPMRNVRAAAIVMVCRGRAGCANVFFPDVTSFQWPSPAPQAAVQVPHHAFLPHDSRESFRSCSTPPISIRGRLSLTPPSCPHQTPRILPAAHTAAEILSVRDSQYGHRQPKTNKPHLVLSQASTGHAAFMHMSCFFPPAFHRTVATSGPRGPH